VHRAVSAYCSKKWVTGCRLTFSAISETSQSLHCLLILVALGGLIAYR